MSNPTAISHSSCVIRDVTEDFEAGLWDPFVSNDKAKELQTELQNFLKICKGNFNRFDALTATLVTGGGKITGFITVSGIAMILRGQKVNGKEGNWSNGTFGSRWCDFEFYNNSVRMAFYSRKHNPAVFEKYKIDKPYAIKFNIEENN